MAKLRIIALLVFVSVFFIALNYIFVGENFNKIKKNSKFYIEKFKASLKYNQCPIEKIDYVPDNSIIIIGHAYGNPENENLFLAPKVSSFLNKHSSRVDVVFFTGDVFQVPSDDKWFKLSTYFNNDFEIYVTPGNHDVGLNESPKRETFKLSAYYFSKSKKVNFQGIDFILEDSIKNDWLIDISSVELINSSQNDVILLRHNISSKDILDVANSDAGMSNNLPITIGKTDLFERDLIIISGDGGAKAYMPRTFCRKSGNVLEIISGIGEHPGDEIIIINESKIYLHEI